MRRIVNVTETYGRPALGNVRNEEPCEARLSQRESCLVSVVPRYQSFSNCYLELSLLPPGIGTVVENLVVKSIMREGLRILLASLYGSSRKDTLSLRTRAFNSLVWPSCSLGYQAGTVEINLATAGIIYAAVD